MISCIVLAAGSSTRFGSPKPLAKISGQIVIELLLNKLLKTKISEIIVVLGSDAELIGKKIPENPLIKTAFNKDHLKGQTSSFRTGLLKVSPESRAAMLLPCDTPLFKIESVEKIIEAFIKKSKKIIIPVFKDKKGHPSLFSKELFPEFLGLDNKDPLFTIQRRHSDEILHLPLDDEGILKSFNTPQELNKITT